MDRAGTVIAKPVAGLSRARHASEIPPAHGIGFAAGAAMIDIALSVLALVAGGLTLELYAAGAPLGDQDEKGFRPGLKVSPGAEDCPGEQPS